MKIAIFTDTFMPQVNGIVSSVCTLAKGLGKRGHTVYIYAPKFDDNPDINEKNVIIKRHFSIPAYFYEGFKFSFPFYPKLLLELKKNEVDIVHFHTPIMLGFQAITLAKFLGLPLIGTFHTFIADPHYLKHVKLNASVMQKAAWNYCNFYYNFCDLVTCPSESAKREFLENGCKKPVKVISNGIDLSIFDNKLAEKQKKRLNPHGKILLFVGRIAHEKNIIRLLNIFMIIVRKVPSVRLVLVGDGPQSEEVKKALKKMKIDKDVIMTGAIPHSKLVKSGIFGAADIFVTASTTETQGITLLEAQANGIVCVGVDSRGVSELIEDGENGYLADPKKKHEFADKVIRLLEDRRLYSRMRRATLKKVQQHDIGKVLDEWEKSYGNIISYKLRNN